MYNCQVTAQKIKKDDEFLTYDLSVRGQE